MIRWVEEQPEQLAGHEYCDEAYRWFEMVGPDGAVYAVGGVAFRDGNREAWLYWRITGFSVPALRELRRRDVPALRRYCRERGAVVAKVASSDPADVNFPKMVGLMGFEVVCFGYQSLEDCHVRRRW
ncbi:hypothetical protein ACR42D_10020 [Desulfovibrio caledoniensis]